MRTLLNAIAVLAVFALIISGCKKKEDSPTSPTGSTHASGSFSGVLAGTTSAGAPVSGKLSLSIPSSKSVYGNESPLTVYTVTGTYTIGGTSVNVTGSYNTDNDSLYVSASTGFSFKGTYNPSTGVLQGEWTTPSSSGSFVACGGASVAQYEGEWSSTPAGSSGTFNFSVNAAGTKAFGMLYASTYHYPINATITGDSIKWFASYGALSVQIAKGAFTTDHHDASGTYNLSAAGRTAEGNWGASK